MRKLFEMLKKKDVGAIGIGAMIVFIAMVLVAGIAASVLVQTSTKLESQAMKTGQDTIDEVSTGLAVFDIEGYADEDLDKISICVRPRAGSADIDLSTTFVEISDTNSKIILNYSGTDYFVEDADDGKDDLFSQTYFPATAYQFGILVLEDADDSCVAATPVINKGDKILIGVDLTQCFSSTGGIDARTDVMGMVAPEIGSPGVIAFTTPSSYSDYVIDLQ